MMAAFQWTEKKAPLLTLSNSVSIQNVSFREEHMTVKIFKTVSCHVLLEKEVKWYGIILIESRRRVGTFEFNRNQKSAPRRIELCNRNWVVWFHEERQIYDLEGKSLNPDFKFLTMNGRKSLINSSQFLLHSQYLMWVHAEKGFITWCW